MSKMNPVTCLFHFFEALNGAIEVQFCSGLHFYTLSKTLIACRDMQLRFFKVKTLLNNDFNLSISPLMYFKIFFSHSFIEFKLHVPFHFICTCDTVLYIYCYFKPTVSKAKQSFINPLMVHVIWFCYTGWPRKNATTLIVNFKDIINKTELIFLFIYLFIFIFLLCGKFIFQQNDTMIINFG